MKRSTSLLESKHDLRRTVSSKLARLISWTFLSLFGDKIQRHNSRYRLLAVLAARWSFRLCNKDLVWPGDRECLTIYREFPEATFAISDRNFTLYSLGPAQKLLPIFWGDQSVVPVGQSGVRIKAELLHLLV